MRVTRIVAAVIALWLVTGLIVFGGLFLWPSFSASNSALTNPDSLKKEKNDIPRYLYSIGGDEEGPTRPNAVAVDRKGRVYITDAGTASVFVYSADGRQSTRFGGPGKSKFAFPNGIVVNDEGNLVIADSVNNDIRLFNPNGKYLETLLKKSDSIRPGIMTRGPDGFIYVSDLLNHRVLAMNRKGKTVRSINDPKQPLSYPQGMAFDPEKRLWVADSGNYSVTIFDGQGKAAGQITGGGEPKISFSLVRGIGIDKKGQAYVSDTISQIIRVFDLKGKLLFEFPQNNEVELVYPTNIVINKDKMYVVDRGANDVKVFSLLEQ